MNREMFRGRQAGRVRILLDLILAASWRRSASARDSTPSARHFLGGRGLLCAIKGTSSVTAVSPRREDDTGGLCVQRTCARSHAAEGRVRAWAGARAPESLRRKGSRVWSEGLGERTVCVGRRCVRARGPRPGAACGGERAAQQRQRPRARKRRSSVWAEAEAAAAAAATPPARVPPPPPRARRARQSHTGKRHVFWKESAPGASFPRAPLQSQVEVIDCCALLALAQKPRARARAATHARAHTHRQTHACARAGHAPCPRTRAHAAPPHTTHTRKAGLEVGHPEFRRYNTRTRIVSSPRRARAQLLISSSRRARHQQRQHGAHAQQRGGDERGVGE
jgi:hypothetical protein